MAQDLVSWLARNVCVRMRQDVISRFLRKTDGKKSGYQHIDRRLEADDLEKHIWKNEPIGLYLMEPETDGYTKIAIVDIDDKTEKLSWDELVQEAKRIDDQLAARLLLSWPCRSGSGHGIHLWLFWNELQPTKVVRDHLLECLKHAKPRCHIDVFPAQDTLGGSLGNLVALPFGRASRPISLTTGLAHEDLKTINLPDPAASAPVLKPEVQRNDRGTLAARASWSKNLNLASDNNTAKLDDYGAPDPVLLKEAMSHIPNADYHTWMRLGLILKGQAEEGMLDDDVAFTLWDDWSETAPNYDPKAQDLNWNRFRPRPNGVGIGTLWYLAKEGGWKPTAEDLDPTPIVHKHSHKVNDPGNSHVTTDGKPIMMERQRDNGKRNAELKAIVDNIALAPKPPYVMPDPVGTVFMDEMQHISDQAVKDIRTITGLDEIEAMVDAEAAALVEPGSLPLMSERLGSSGKNPLPDDPVSADDTLWQSGGGESEVQQMNVRHFVTIDGGRAAVFREDWDAVMHRQHLSRINLHDFRQFYSNRQILVRTTRQGKPVYKPLGELWLESPFRRQYRGIVLRPEGADASEYNLWRGWTVQPAAEGSWELLKEHIFTNLCKGDQVVYEYVLNWWAMLFQKPEMPIGVALVMRGARGTGKSSFVRAFGELLGQHFLHVVNSRSIVGQFNNHLRDCALLFADEAIWAGSKSEESVLKGIITEPTLTIEGKGRDSINCRNMLHLVIATNHDWAVPAGIDERRFCVLEVGDGAKQNTTYFRAIQKQLRDGGQARLLHDMLTRDLRRFDPHKVPVTSELTEQKIHSLEPWALWWYNCLIDGSIYPQHSSWSEPARSDLVYETFCRFTRSMGSRTPPGPPNTLIKNLHKLTNNHVVSKRRRLSAELRTRDDDLTDHRLVTTWQFPDLEECRKYFELLLGDKVNWMDPPEVDMVEPSTKGPDDKILI